MSFRVADYLLRFESLSSIYLPSPPWYNTTIYFVALFGFKVVPIRQHSTGGQFYFTCGLFVKPVKARVCAVMCVCVVYVLCFCFVGAEKGRCKVVCEYV